MRLIQPLQSNINTSHTRLSPIFGVDPTKDPIRFADSAESALDGEPPYYRRPFSAEIVKRESRGGQIRTDDILLPKQALYQAELRPVT
jgi:hypothetical protein